MKSVVTHLAGWGPSAVPVSSREAGCSGSRPPVVGRVALDRCPVLDRTALSGVRLGCTPAPNQRGSGADMNLEDQLIDED